MYGCESWTTKKAERWRTNVFELRCWRRLLRARSNQSILKEISPEYSLEGLMLKLKLQYFGHLMWTADSLGKSLMLWKIEGRRKRGWQRVRWLDGITDSMDMSLSRLRKMVKDGEAWHTAVLGVTKSWTRLNKNLPRRSAGKHRWCGCHYRKSPQGGSTSPCRPLVPQTTRALGKAGFLGRELEWNVPEQNTCSLVSHCFFPLKFHTPDRWTNPSWGHSTPLRVIRC